MSNAYLNNLMECVPHAKELLDYNSDPEVIIESCYSREWEIYLQLYFLDWNVVVLCVIILNQKLHFNVLFSNAIILTTPIALLFYHELIIIWTYFMLHTISLKIFYLDECSKWSSS